MTLAKHWNYNKDEDLVLTNLHGLQRQNPSIGLIPSEKVVYNLESDTSDKIALISGGGAGHEPLHAGFVGNNLLDAAVSGSIFASPSTKQIMAAIKTKSHKNKGTLLILKNYTGDVLHFGLALEKTKNEGYAVEMLAVADDVAIGREQNEMVGRRGIAGVALVHKILGSATGLNRTSDLKLTYKLGQLVNENLVTLGASLDRTSVPGMAEDVEFTAENEMELGLGIHNEPGVKIKPIPNIDDLIKKMFHMLTSPEDKSRHYVDFNLKQDDYILLVNNIGGTSSLELMAVTEHVYQNLPFAKRPKRVYVSDFVTSLNSPGFSITLLNLSNIEKADKNYSASTICELLDAPTNAPGWKPHVYDLSYWDKEEKEIKSPMENHKHPTSSLKMDKEKFSTCLRAALKRLLENEPDITKYDTQVGDGDCGETLAAGAHSILKALDNSKDFKSSLDDPVASLYQITDLVEGSMGGTSGGIYSIFLTALVNEMQDEKSLDLDSLAKAFHNALYNGLFKYTKARVGGRTLIDTLQPFVDSLSKEHDLDAALKAAKDGCESTKKLKAKFGRASYVDESQFKGGIPDPGALGVLCLLEGYISAYK